jgi:hemoglobin-like flavoprotein
MSITRETIALVRESFATAAQVPNVGLLFYRDLFALQPSLRQLFSADIDAQAERLVQMIAIAVDKLDDLEALVPVLQQLGRRHDGYGVTELHYVVVGTALMRTLNEGLGAAFTPAHQQAWTAVYGLMANTMMGAARMQVAA